MGPCSRGGSSFRGQAPVRIRNWRSSRDLAGLAGHDRQFGMNKRCEWDAERRSAYPVRDQGLSGAGTATGDHRLGMEIGGSAGRKCAEPNTTPRPPRPTAEEGQRSGSVRRSGCVARRSGSLCPGIGGPAIGGPAIGGPVIGRRGPGLWPSGAGAVGAHGFLQLTTGLAQITFDLPFASGRGAWLCHRHDLILLGESDFYDRRTARRAG